MTTIEAMCERAAEALLEHFPAGSGPCNRPGCVNAAVGILRRWGRGGLPTDRQRLRSDLGSLSQALLSVCGTRNVRETASRTEFDRARAGAFAELAQIVDFADAAAGA